MKFDKKGTKMVMNAIQCGQMTLVMERTFPELSTAPFAFCRRKFRELHYADMNKFRALLNNNKYGPLKQLLMDKVDYIKHCQRFYEGG